MNDKGFEALDIVLRDACNKNVPFADIPVLLTGDYRQTLQVIQEGTPSDDIQACSDSSPL